MSCEEILSEKILALFSNRATLDIEEHQLFGKGKK
jgi:hypothetical protein